MEYSYKVHGYVIAYLVWIRLEFGLQVGVSLFNDKEMGEIVEK